MTDMNTGMPFWWYQPAGTMNPVQTFAGWDAANNARLSQSAADTVASNNALAQQTFDQGQQNFWNWSDNATRLNAAYVASNLAIGNAQPVGTYNGNALSPFAVGTAPVQHLGGTTGLQPFNPGSYLVKNPDVFQAGADPWQHYNQFGQNENRQGAWGTTDFNTSNYLANNQDVWQSGANPIQHWLMSGYDEGRQGGFGGPDFNEQNYLANNPDVFKAGADPVQHWLQYGQNENRTGGWGENPFNPQEYLLQNRDVAAAGIDPTAHWMTHGYNEGREAAFGGTEDADWSKYLSGASTGRDQLAAEYFMANQDVYDAARASGQDPTKFGFEHLMNYGQDEGRQFFDEQGYLEQNQDIAAAGVDPTAHWFEYGQKEGRAMPTGQFHPWEYYIANPDVVNANMDAMQHYITYGQDEGRSGGWEWSSRNRGGPYPARMAASPAMEGNSAALAAQNKAYADSIRNDPAQRILFAARLHSELGNDPAGRTAITEAMLNRLAARGLNPLDPRYYPTDADAVRHYNESLALMRSNPNMVNTVMQDAERAFGGSNYSNYATDWASQVAGMTVAERARLNATATWTSPANEEFFRRDRTGTDTGDAAARQIQNWYNSLANPFPR